MDTQDSSFYFKDDVFNTTLKRVNENAKEALKSTVFPNQVHMAKIFLQRIKRVLEIHDIDFEKIKTIDFQVSLVKHYRKILHNICT